MLKFYFSKGSSALAAHILLEEVGANYEAIETPIAERAHKSTAFLALNPKGRLPALETPQGMLTENPAILEYIAEANPRAGCQPEGTFEKAQARELAAYLGATVHVAFAHKQRSARWADEATSIADMQAVTPRNLADCAGLLETQLALSPWALGAPYTYADPYLFLVGRWLHMVGLSLGEYPRLADHRDLMLARPATQRALKVHGLG